MSQHLIYVNNSSGIPLMGVDFMGVIDRGTNVIELKPNTTCNLKCKYCFVSAGDYDTNFIVSSDYLIEKVREAITIKGAYEIEIHIAPYGEILLYPELFNLLEKLKKIQGIETVSMQSNGLLLTTEIIEKLKILKLTRINLSLNTLNSKMAEYLCNCSNYDMEKLKDNILHLIKSGIDVLLAPVWFPGENDEDIEDIIKYVIDLRKDGFSEQHIRLGIQKYLVYKTGRRLKKVRPKTWAYFYKQLSLLEKKYDIKLKLGPLDFGIHKRQSISRRNFKKGDIIRLKIISKGRWERECVGKIDENLGIKVLLRKGFTFSTELLGNVIDAKIIKANYKDNIITAVFPTS